MLHVPNKMSEWIEIVKAHHQRYSEKDGYALIINPGADENRLNEIQDHLRWKFPKNLIEIYRECDGYGISWPGLDVDWNLMPILDLENFANDVRGWFKETHPVVASRFFPFFNWGTGDSIGFLADENGISEKLYEFSHDSYEFDEAQNWKDFIQYEASSIKEFLCR